MIPFMTPGIANGIYKKKSVSILDRTPHKCLSHRNSSKVRDHGATDVEEMTFGNSPKIREMAKGCTASCKAERRESLGIHSTQFGMR